MNCTIIVTLDNNETKIIEIPALSVILSNELFNFLKKERTSSLM